MSYYSVALARTDSGWSAAELELDEVSNVDEAAEQLREFGPDADLALLFVEADEEYLAILRLDEDDDFVVFGSDAAFAAASTVGEMLIGDLKPLQQLAKPDAEVEEAELEVEETDGLDEKFDDSDVDENKEVDEDLYDGLHEGAADTENDPAQTPASTTSAAAADEQTEGGAVVAAAGEPVGDAALLADLGIVAAELIALCAQDHMLPSDVIAEICGRIGCGAEYEELRDSATL